jgi:hypothetical protein
MKSSRRAASATTFSVAPFTSFEDSMAEKGAPHGICTTQKDEVNADLLAFIKG